MLSLAACLLLGSMASVVPSVALLVGALCLLAASLFLSPTVILLAVLPLAFAVWRVPLVPQGISVADVALATGLCVVATRGRRLSPLGQRVLRAIVAYQALLLVPVVVHPTSSALIDWGHRFFLTAGALLVGNEIAQSSKRIAALKVFVFACATVGAVAVVQSVTSDFTPAYPLGISKNLAGEVLAAGALVAIAVGEGVLGSRRVQLLLGGLAFLGLVATQSRGAWFGFGIALLVWVIYVRPSRRVVLGLAVLALAGGMYVVTSLAAESELENSIQTSSLESRQHFETVALSYFDRSPLVGQGIRFYLDPGYDFPVPLGEEGSTRPAPHNLIVEALSEAGIVGLAALLVLIGQTSVSLARQPTRYTILALAALLGNFGHGTVDIYWLAGSLTVPWVLIGLACWDSETIQRKGSALSLATVPA